MNLFEIFKAVFKNKNKNTVTINGTRYESSSKLVICGNSITRNVIIDDKIVFSTDGTKLDITINGDCEKVSTTSGDLTIYGDAKLISTTSGDVTVSGTCNSVSTTSGDVECGDILGSVRTVSGDITN